MDDRSLTDAIASATLGVDTLWGGNVLSASGTGRFIADCWFSNEALPPAYTHPSAARVRDSGGVAAERPDARLIDEYLCAVDIPAAIDGIRRGARELTETPFVLRPLDVARGRPEPVEGRQAQPERQTDPVRPELVKGRTRLRRRYLEGLADSFEAMWDLALEMLGRGPSVPFERCVLAAIGQRPVPSNPVAKMEQLRRLLGGRGDGLRPGEPLAAAVDRWRAERRVEAASIPSLAAIRIGELDRLSKFHLMPHLPAELDGVPRANIQFLPIQDAWFSGSMNYLGRARAADGQPQYEATYEINAALEISIPEFEQLVAHEVVPGHVTTFAFLQNLYVRGRVAFEASVLTINTRAAALFEGIANNAILIAHGVTDLDAVDDPDTQIGVLLAQLQDEAKNQAAWLTWHEGMPADDVATALRRDFAVSGERASKLARGWARHPLLGRMCLPAYRAGTETVARLRRAHPPSVVLPAIYGCRGLVDIVTVQEMLDDIG